MNIRGLSHAPPVHDAVVERLRPYIDDVIDRKQLDVTFDQLDTQLQWFDKAGFVLVVKNGDETVAGVAAVAVGLVLGKWDPPTLDYIPEPWDDIPRLIAGRPYHGE